MITITANPCMRRTIGDVHEVINHQQYNDRPSSNHDNDNNNLTSNGEMTTTTDNDQISAEISIMNSWSPYEDSVLPNRRFKLDEYRPSSTPSNSEIAMVLVFLLSTRLGLVQVFLGVSFERSLNGHYWCGFATLILSVFYGCHGSYHQNKWNPSTWDFVY
eukprot:Awhi_evm1s4024